MEMRRLVYQVLVEWFNQASSASFDEVCWLIGERTGRVPGARRQLAVADVLAELVKADALVRESGVYFPGAFFSEVCYV